MQIQEATEKYPSPPSPSQSYKESIKYEESVIEEDAESMTNEFGHGNGNFWTGYFNVTCIVAGTGTLGLPHAFALGGWIGIFILLLSYLMAIYSGIILIRCLYYKPGQRLHDYKSVGTAAFGWLGYGVASFLHWLNLFGCPALYLVLASSNMNYLLRYTQAALDFKSWCCIIGAVLLIPSLITKTLREVSVLSAVGALCTMIAVFIVAIQSPLDHNSNPNIHTVTDSVIWTGFPSALSTIAFSYGGINTYPHVEHALKKPNQWKWCVIFGLGTCTILYLLTAVPGYWAFGRETLSPIYNNLNDQRKGKIIAIIVMTIHVILAIPIYTTSFSLEFEKWTNITDERLGKLKAWLIRAIIRTCTMAVLVILAIFIPYFGDFMSLIGALSNCGLVFLLPVLCYLKLTGFRNKPIYELAFCALTIFMGIVGCIFGTIDAIKALVSDFTS
ncbi:transmembrane amino acid transporter protein-domain-containing protein [Cokeromyces recurvatus]|uniref:transmembrane amino acid transporter protein-domain-containing protein n=1 Tax=Cokeromyces recurvatus TaxID=90255 RepID=UPI00221EF74B|nr:transmembrane amino acid transporter protein-domain-containing protein [Cokeromyces recurvatus]KAI7907533.1 transmembrane amino acid transporter protein-domain-containing protein [Cokeromyces recurvatus]